MENVNLLKSLISNEEISISDMIDKFHEIMKENCEYNDLLSNILLKEGTDNLIVSAETNGRVAYNMLCFISQLLSKRNPNRSSAATVVEPYLIKLIECVNTKLCKQSKYMDSLDKMLLHWIKKEFFKSIDDSTLKHFQNSRKISNSTINKEKNEFDEILATTESVLNTRLHNINSANFSDGDVVDNVYSFDNISYKGSFIINALCQEMKLSSDIRSTSYELLHLYLNYIVKENDLIDITILSITCIFLSCKLWWDTYGPMSINTILRVYHKTLHHNKILKITINDLNNFSNIVYEYISKYEFHLLTYLNFDVISLSTIICTNKLFLKIMSRLEIDEHSRIIVKDLLLHESIGYTILYICDNFKYFILSCCIISLQPSDDIKTQWLKSMKIDLKTIKGYIKMIEDIHKVWNNNISPNIIHILSQKKMKDNKQSLSNENIDTPKKSEKDSILSMQTSTHLSYITSNPFNDSQSENVMLPHTPYVMSQPLSIPHDNKVDNNCSTPIKASSTSHLTDGVVRTSQSSRWQESISNNFEEGEISNDELISMTIENKDNDNHGFNKRCLSLPNLNEFTSSQPLTEKSEISADNVTSEELNTVRRNYSLDSLEDGEIISEEDVNIHNSKKIINDKSLPIISVSNDQVNKIEKSHNNFTMHKRRRSTSPKRRSSSLQRSYRDSYEPYKRHNRDYSDYRYDDDRHVIKYYHTADKRDYNNNSSYYSREYNNNDKYTRQFHDNSKYRR